MFHPGSFFNTGTLCSGQRILRDATLAEAAAWLQNSALNPALKATVLKAVKP